MPIYTRGSTIPSAGTLVPGFCYEAIRFAGRWRLVGGIGQAELSSGRADRILSDAQMGSVVLESVGGTGDAIAATVLTVLTARGVAVIALASASGVRRIFRGDGDGTSGGWSTWV
ncbi:MAG: hypothetical protein QM682_16920 [Paracoccus sp. (in: a-proteobacteria)]|uniref:hypothetical protein n=1 Tax=Paracoccus sp. TaxID=267 RepID=UPI0039E3811C